MPPTRLIAGVAISLRNKLRLLPERKKPPVPIFRNEWLDLGLKPAVLTSLPEPKRNWQSSYRWRLLEIVILLAYADVNTNFSVFGDD